MNDGFIKTFDGHHPKRISYILTTKNRPKFLDTALERMKSSIKPIDELLIIDGGSGPDVLAVLEKYQDIITLVVSEQDISPAHALNKGIMLARGKYIRQITDDDIMHPEGMEQAITVMETHPEVDLLICGGTKQFKKWYSTVCHPPGTNYGQKPEDALRYKSSGAGCVFRRSLFTKVGLYSFKEAADGEFPARCISQGAVVRFCRINLYHHTIYPHSTIESKRKQYDQDRRRTVRQYGSFSFYVKDTLRMYTMAMPGGSFLWKMYKKMFAAKNDWKKLPIRHPEGLWDGGFS